jgi:uncharacterized protein with HEPN domain
MDKLSAIELIDFCIDSIDTINYRFEPIKNVDDFTHSPAGMEKLDAIMMRLQAIGEAIKNIDKHFDILILVNKKEYWSNIIKLRELLSHHYVDIDALHIFQICNEDLEELKQNLLTLKEVI